MEIDLSNKEVVKALKERAKQLGLITPNERNSTPKEQIYCVDKFDKWNRFVGITIIMTVKGVKKSTTFPQGNNSKKDLQAMVDTEMTRLKRKFNI